MLINVRPQNVTLEEHTKNLLNLYYRNVENTEIVGNNKDSILKSISDTTSTIVSVLESYSSAHVANSINSLQKFIHENKNRLMVMEVDAETNEDDINWFRMRIQEKNKRTFSSNEMFHIPFQLRGKVNTQRYSLPGYPCLYVSRSIWATWEEMHEPNLSNFCVSLLQPVSKFKVLDLRIIDDSKLELFDVEKVLCTMPLIIACSIKVLYPDDNFKPEYIIPQLIMLALVDEQDWWGCAYTSTQRNPLFQWSLHKLDNLALPVKMVEREGLCTKLCNLFQITDATNYEYEMLKKPFETSFWVTDDNYGIHDEGEDYENSIFGQMEDRLKGMELKKLHN